MGMSFRLGLAALLAAGAAAVNSGCIRTISVEINSEPPQARTYLYGQFIGTTPVIVDYNVPEELDNGGIMELPGIIMAKEGYKPKEVSMRCPVKKIMPIHQSFSNVVFLERDPTIALSYRRVDINQNSDSDSSALDNANKAINATNSILDGMLKASALRAARGR